MRYRTGEIDRSRCRVYGTHHIHMGACVKSEVLRNTRHFVSREHNAKTKQRMRLHRDQSHHEQCRLHERRKAKCYDLLAPARKAFCHTSWETEQIQATYGDLREQDATSLDVGEKSI